MTREVFDNSMTCHVWAQGRQDSGRSNNGNLFFSGRALYSYGRHFLIGWLLDSGAALLNSDSYSISTGKHQSYAARAVRGRVYRVPALTAIAPALEMTTRAQAARSDEYGRQRQERARAELLAHVEKHDMPHDSAVLLLTLAGLAEDKAEARAVRLREKGQKAAKAAKEKAARELTAGHVSAVRRIAKLTRAAWAEELAAYGFRYGRPVTPAGLAYDLAEAAAALRKALYHAGRANAPAKALRDKARARMGELLAAAEAAERKESRRQARGRAAGNRAALRAYLAAPETIEKRGLESAASAVAFYQEHGRGLVSASALAAYGKAIADRLAALRQAAEAARFAKQAEARAEWLAGKPGRAYGLACAQGGAMLRAVNVTRDDSGQITGGTLETSQGADVPLLHALRAFAFLKLCHETGREWRANDRTIRVGHFRIDSVAPDHFRAGCHVIYWPEIQRLAQALGVVNMAASDSALEPSHAAA